MKFYPSRAHRWAGGGCTGSVKAEAAMPRRPSSSDSAEGIRLHALAAGQLLGADEEPPAADWGQVREYVQDVTHTCRLHKHGGLVEQKVTHPLFTNGFIDCHLWYPGRLIIWDYKSGRRPVEAVGNDQLLVYAIMLLQPLIDAGAELPTVELRIVQPNCWHPDGHVRGWVVDDFMSHYNRITTAVDQANYAPQLVATPSNCTYCNAVTSCRAARDVTLGAADMMLIDTGALPAEAIRSELVTLRTTAKLVQTRLDALEAETEVRLGKGETVPGCGMVSGGRGKLKWTADESEIMKVATALGVDPVKKTLFTPKQMIDTGLPADVVDVMAKRTASKMQVSTESDAEMEKIFNV